MTLPTVDSIGSNSRTSSKASNDDEANAMRRSGGGGTSTAFHQPAMLKRSPYLSAMASTSKESYDLVEMLSRPTGNVSAASQSAGVVGAGATHTGGSSQFFDLKRASTPQKPLDSATVTPVSSKGSVDLSSGESSGDEALPPQGRPQMSKLRSSLRMSIKDIENDVSKDTPDDCKDTFDIDGEMKANESGMKGKRGVSFSTNTKRGRRGTIPELLSNDMSAGFDMGPTTRQGFNTSTKYSAATMLTKSQSIACPQSMRASSMRTGGQTNTGIGAPNKDEGGNAQFPIYLGNLGGAGGNDAGENVSSSADTAASRGKSAPSNFSAQSRRSQSVQTLQYFYKNGMNERMNEQAGVASGDDVLVDGLQISSKKSTITFKDMLDKGDGTEGDLNSQQRNQRWKNFSQFSTEFQTNNSGLVGGNNLSEPQDTGGEATDGDADNSPKRTVGSKGQLEANEENVSPSAIPLSGLKRAVSPSGVLPSSTKTSSRQNLQGAHRASVSVNDLAIFRKSAARMDPGLGGGGDGTNWTASQPSAGRSSNVPPGGGKSDFASTMMAMMASKSAGSTVQQRRAMQTRSAGGDVLTPMLRDNGVPMKKIDPVVASFMGRRSMTVGAGLAYGGANWKDVGSGQGRSLSRFNLGALEKGSRDKILSHGNAPASGRGNAEW